MSEANKRAQIAYLRSLIAERDAALQSARACLRHAHDRLVDYDHEMETLRITINAEVRAISAILATSCVPSDHSPTGDRS